MEEIFRVIPGYDNYAVTHNGVVISIVRNLVLKDYLLNGYLIVDTFRGSLTETLPVHRAAALAWVHNPKPEEFNVVNHLDGNPTNNHRSNLEWTNTSGNNYHAIAMGLRSDNIPVKLRDFETKEIILFPSVNQAVNHLGLCYNSKMSSLQPKMFGKLINDRYEVKYQSDNTPWFYENRYERIKPSRYMVVVTKPDGSKEEIYSNVSLLQKYQLYSAPAKSMESMVEFARITYPDHIFELHDSYTKKLEMIVRGVKPTLTLPVTAEKNGEMMKFRSLTETAKFFNVDRSSILGRLGKSKNLNGWVFT